MNVVLCQPFAVILINPNPVFCYLLHQSVRFLELWILVDPLYIYYVFEVPKFLSSKKIPDFENSPKGNCMAAKGSTEFKLPLRLSHEG